MKKTSVEQNPTVHDNLFRNHFLYRIMIGKKAYVDSLVTKINNNEHCMNCVKNGHKFDFGKVGNEFDRDDLSTITTKFDLAFFIGYMIYCQKTGKTNIISRNDWIMSILYYLCGNQEILLEEVVKKCIFSTDEAVDFKELVESISEARCAREDAFSKFHDIAFKLARLAIPEFHHM